jgi:hypothetical protein
MAPNHPSHAGALRSPLIHVQSLTPTTCRPTRCAAVCATQACQTLVHMLIAKRAIWSHLELMYDQAAGPAITSKTNFYASSANPEESARSLLTLQRSLDRSWPRSARTGQTPRRLRSPASTACNAFAYTRPRAEHSSGLAECQSHGRLVA